MITRWFIRKFISGSFYQNLIAKFFLIFTTLTFSGMSLHIDQKIYQEQSIILVTSAQDAGPGSFRQALLEAKPGTIIRFSSHEFPQSSPGIIEVLSPYPLLDDGFVTIDASDVGVTLDGSRLPNDSEISALNIISNGNIIKGLEIINFTASAFFISDGASNNVIGGSNKGEGNILWGNLDGINITGKGTANNKVIGNLIGTDRTGLKAIGNRAAGIWIGFNASGNIIGGRIAIEGNVISGNDSGVIIQYSNSNMVIGNLIGTDITGKRVLISTKSTGVGLNFVAENNIIGGEGEERNVISGNGDSISLNGKGVSQNKILGNYIGMDITGKIPLGNLESGIHIMDGANNNEIGPHNKIAFNQKVGIVVEGPDSLNNRITQNSIYSNEVTAILNRDGGNLEITAPEITTVEPRSVRGQASPNHIIEIFSDSSDECEYYEGQTTSDISGNFSYMLPIGSFQGKFITATSLDQNGNSSQLSNPAKNPAFNALKELPGILAPEQISVEPLVIGTNIALALLSALYFGFTSSVFNEILKGYGEELLGFINHFMSGFQKTNRLGKIKKITKRLKHQKWAFIFFWMIFILVTSLVESFLDPELELIGLGRLRIIFTLFVSGLIVSGIEWQADRLAHHQFAQLTEINVRTNWAGILFATASVIISRLLHFTPGYIYGIIGAVYLSPKIKGQIQSGKRALLVQASIFLCSLGFWLLSSRIAPSLVVLEPVFLTIFLVGLQGTFFQILPVSIFDGYDIFRWKKGIWFVLFIIILFCFYHFSLNPDGQDIQALQQNGVQIICLAMAIFGLATLGLWLLFPYRSKHHKN